MAPRRVFWRMAVAERLLLRWTLRWKERCYLMTSPSEPRTPSVSALVRALAQLGVPHALDEATLSALPPARRKTVLLAHIAAGATYLERRHNWLDDRGLSGDEYREINRKAVDAVTSGRADQHHVRKVIVANDLLHLAGDVAALAAADRLRVEAEQGLDRIDVSPIGVLMPALLACAAILQDWQRALADEREFNMPAAVGEHLEAALSAFDEL
ncbi:hypothetical protein SAMN04489732_14712 [Amycolatopsis saalfeldensis]|uniref:Uncharacterized protein n=3 Tax=Amycolatopsis TaxID=1813 RepID=A0A1H8YQI4_9PSEU|nr:hypothetical protein SAMN04489732_14712 [Amycolatopsis saalfeldensis]